MRESATSSGNWVASPSRNRPTNPASGSPGEACGPLWTPSTTSSNWRQPKTRTTRGSGRVADSRSTTSLRPRQSSRRASAESSPSPKSGPYGRNHTPSARGVEGTSAARPPRRKQRATDPAVVGLSGSPRAREAIRHFLTGAMLIPAHAPSFSTSITGSSAWRAGVPLSPPSNATNASCSGLRH